MSNVNYSFSIDYSIPSSETGDTDLFAFDDCIDFPLPGNQHLVRSKRTGRQGILTSDALFALRQCNRFRPWNSQIDEISKLAQPGAANRDDIRNVLESTRQAGLVVSAREFLASLQPATPQHAEMPATYCILTCDRPAALSRLLDSLRRNHHFQPDRNHYFVLDDSRNTENQQQNQAAVDQARKKWGSPFQYIGNQQRSDMLSRLKALLPEANHDAIDFLLSDKLQPELPSYGRNRNWALVLGAGTHTIMLDDDILFEKRIPRYASGDVAIGRHRREAAFFQHDEEWRNCRLDESPDPTAGQALSLLGKSLPQALSLLGIRQPSPSMLHETESGILWRLTPQSRVLITLCGSLGDPGTASGQWAFELKEGSRQRFMGDPAHYRQNITERNCWLGSPQFQLSPSFAVMSAVTAIDGTAPVPPYFPLFRNEDLLFGSMLQQLHPQGLVADLPWAVPHLPLEKRRWDRSKLFQPAGLGFHRFSDAQLVSHCMKLPLEQERRQREFSDLFYTLSETPDPLLSRMMEEQLMLERSARIHKLTQGLEEAGDQAPAYWRQDILAIIQANQKGLMEPGSVRFADFPKSQAQPLELAKRMWHSYADALYNWQSIVGAAKMLNH